MIMLCGGGYSYSVSFLFYLHFCPFFSPWRPRRRRPFSGGQARAGLNCILAAAGRPRDSADNRRPLVVKPRSQEPGARGQAPSGPLPRPPGRLMAGQHLARVNTRRRPADNFVLIKSNVSPNDDQAAAHGPSPSRLEWPARLETPTHSGIGPDARPHCRRRSDKFGAAKLADNKFIKARPRSANNARALRRPDRAPRRPKMKHFSAP